MNRKTKIKAEEFLNSLYKYVGKEVKGEAYYHGALDATIQILNADYTRDNQGKHTLKTTK